MSPGATVVAFHGGGVGPSLWDEVRRRAPELHFITPHLGEEAKAARGQGPALMDRLEALLPSGPCVFAGVSLGTLFAVELAARAGARTQGVLLMSGGPPHEDAPWLQKVRGMMSFLTDAYDPKFVPALVNVLLYRNGPDFLRLSKGLGDALLKESGEPSVSLARAVESRPRLTHDALAQIAAPIEVWFGRYDPSIEAGWADAWAKSAHVARIDAVSHEIPLEAPDRVAGALKSLHVSAHERQMCP